MTVRRLTFGIIAVSRTEATQVKTATGDQLTAEKSLLRKKHNMVAHTCKRYPC